MNQTKELINAIKEAINDRQGNMQLQTLEQMINDITAKKKLPTKEAFCTHHPAK